jgi:defect-in-organelle-trafficking protein DotC
MSLVNAKMIRPITLALLASIALSACATTSAPVQQPEAFRLGAKDDLNLGAPPPGLGDYTIGVYDPNRDTGGIPQIRRKALTEAALVYGTQAGYARRSYEIEALLQERSLELNQVYDFDRVVMGAPLKTGYIVPPVVSRSFEAFVSDDAGQTVSAADEYLTIVAPGRIAPVLPTWRDYLLFNSAAPEQPPRSLLPADRSEQTFFRGEFAKGFKEGVLQADAALGEKLARLRRDFEGMLQYRRLVAQGMMDRMVIADADFGVTGAGNEMRIGDRTVRVVSQAEFNTRPESWRVAPVTEREQAIVANGLLSALPGMSDVP